jgi:hypothetical protein
MGCTSAGVLNIHAEVLKESAIAGIQWSPREGRLDRCLFATAGSSPEDVSHPGIEGIMRPFILTTSSSQYA